MIRKPSLNMDNDMILSFLVTPTSIYSGRIPSSLVFSDPSKSPLELNQLNIQMRRFPPRANDESLLLFVPSNGRTASSSLLQAHVYMAAPIFHCSAGGSGGNR